MGYNLDVALVGEDGEVVARRLAMPPGSFLSHPRARCAMERPARDGPWPAVGERLWIVSASPSAAGQR